MTNDELGIGDQVIKSTNVSEHTEVVIDSSNSTVAVECDGR